VEDGILWNAARKRDGVIPAHSGGTRGSRVSGGGFWSLRLLSDFSVIFTKCAPEPTYRSKLQPYLSSRSALPSRRTSNSESLIDRANLVSCLSKYNPSGLCLESRTRGRKNRESVPSASALALAIVAGKPGRALGARVGQDAPDLRSHEALGAA
jgi:hypothetical protein